LPIQITTLENPRKSGGHDTYSPASGPGLTVLKWLGWEDHEQEILGLGCGGHQKSSKIVHQGRPFFLFEIEIKEIRIQNLDP